MKTVRWRCLLGHRWVAHIAWPWHQICGRCGKERPQ